MEHINPISDELIAAYLEGKATPAETRLVLSAMQHDAELREVLSVVSQSDAPVSISLYPMQSMAADEPHKLCAFYSELYVLRKRGIETSESELLQLAHEHRWVTEQGTPLHAIGQLLASQGLMITRQYDATISDIQRALQANNEVIVAVDIDKLYPNRPDPDDAPNHAMVITAIDTEVEVITLYEPDVNDLMDYQLEVFMNAWKESRNYMIRVLQKVEDYVPHPLDLDNVPLTDDLIELQEAIAENAHEVWAAARRREGWTYGPVRDDSLKQHPDMLPYSALPDSEKEYDRLMAINTIKLLEKLGWEIGRC